MSNIIKIALCITTFCISLKTFSAPIPLPTPSVGPVTSSWKIKTHNNYILCVKPVSSGYDTYLYLDNCNNDTQWEFDVFGRISTVFKGVKVCVTLPYSITSGTNSWDYLRISPCDLGNPHQEMTFKVDNFYTKENPQFSITEMRFKDYKWSLYVGTDPSYYYDHQLYDVSKQKWVTSVSKPSSLGIGIMTGPLEGVDSQLLFDENSGHIIRKAMYEYRYSCLFSPKVATDNYEWASWTECNKNSTKFNIVPTGSNDEFYILSKDSGYYLGRVLKGAGTGDPLFFAGKKYFKQHGSTDYSTYKFALGKKYSRYERYKNQNLTLTSSFCPAPGKKVTKVSLRVSQYWRMTEEWFQRIYHTVLTQGEELVAEFCGECLLQTVQLIQEVFANENQPPSGSHGYYFNLNTPDIMQDFRTYYPNVVRNLISYQNVLENRPDNEDEAEFQRSSLAVALQTLLPNLDVSMFMYTEEIDEIGDITSSMRSAPLGSTFIIELLSEDHAGHVFFAINTHEGMRVFDTAQAELPHSEGHYRHSVQPLFTAQQIEDAIMATRPEMIESFTQLVVYRVRNLSSDGQMNLALSQGDCLNEKLPGQPRAGNGQFPSASQINQCLNNKAGYRCGASIFYK